MKCMLILLISLLISIPLALGGIAGIAYYTTSEDSVPKPVIKAMDKELSACGYSWREPVFGGLIYRDFTREAGGDERVTNLGMLEHPTFPLEIPDGYQARATIFFDEEQVWSGRTQELSGYNFLNNGRYRMLVDCERNGGGIERGHGSQ